VSQGYQHPETARGALRLHLNENTAGASPKVVDAVRALGRDDLALYPEYTLVYRDVAAHLGVLESSVLVTNGLDEGILLAAVVAQKRRPVEGPPEAVVILPTFDMYAITSDACGVGVVTVAPGPEYQFPLQATLSAITPRTRVVFITSPNNPTGVRVSNDDIRAVARAVPRDALVFVDEAYHDFCGDTMIGELGSLPNVVVGRTFAKAQGLAALRAGALVAAPETLDAFRPVIPPYSLNVAARRWPTRTIWRGTSIRCASRASCSTRSAARTDSAGGRAPPTSSSPRWAPMPRRSRPR
jgi:histidinol-phosphate aminotransferase